ncbi:MAG: lytic transglycosylase domain-containing protein [Deltaproteobacteria bacterium]|nr:lytic transglycosylase domain-containing protein [Deltaproteobacteria bacterium]
MLALLAAVLLGATPAAPATRPPFRAADAAPLLAAPAEQQAVRDLAEGRAEAAAAGLAASRSPESRYVRALALVALGRGPEAAEVLAGVEERLPEVADRVAWLRGQALDQAGRPLEAAEAWGSIGAGSLLRAEAALARARRLEAAGQRALALDALSPLLGAPAPDDASRPDQAAEALLLAARLRAEPAAARPDLLLCWAGHPLSPAAARCREALAALPPPHGAPPPPADALRRAEALLEANRNRAAIAELTALRDLQAGPASPDACRARLALGRAYRKERRHQQALEVLRPALLACADAPGRQKALHAAASSAAVAAPAEAVGRYRELAEQFPESPVADDALFFAADMLARAGRTGEARAALLALAERYPRGDYRPEALFRAAWLSWRERDPAQALELLGRLQDEYQDSDPYESARAAYWRARVLAGRRQRGDVATARALWGMLVERYPADYYGLLARARLAEARGSEPPWKRLPEAEADLQFQAGELRADPHFRAGLWLLRVGQVRAASEELRAVDRALILPGSAHFPDPLLLTAELLHRTGDHRAAHNLVRTAGRQVLRQRPEGAILRLWRIAYPPAWRDEVTRWAPPAGVPTDLLQAIMREESALDPAAVSGAGAVGLTQLMVPTAQQAARKLRLGRSIGVADLMDGPLNIRLGAVHLGDVLRRLGGSAPLAIAAYNAGEGQVRAWLRDRGTLPLDEFVEEIPIQETRGYVKRVLRSYAAYRLLYGGPGELPVPLAQKLPVLGAPGAARAEARTAR